MSAQDSLDAFLRRGKEDFLARHKRKAPTKAAPEADAPRKRGTPERDAQRAVVAWLRKAGCIVQASFSEQAAASKSAAERYRFGQARKKSGVSPGWPDLTIVTPEGRIAFVELKSRTGRLSDTQRAMHAELTARGVVVVVAYDIWSTQDALREAGVVITAPRLRLAAPVAPL